MIIVGFDNKFVKWIIGSGEGIPIWYQHNWLYNGSVLFNMWHSNPMVDDFKVTNLIMNDNKFWIVDLIQALVGTVIQ
jgi:hypothetical protein